MHLSSNLISLPDHAPVPYPSPHGWYHFKGQPNTRIEGSASIGDTTEVRGNAIIGGRASIRDQAIVSCNAQVYDDSVVSGKALVTGHSVLRGTAIVSDYAIVKHYAVLVSGAIACGRSHVYNGVLCGHVILAWCCTNWACLSAPGFVTLGCQEYLASEILDPTKDLRWDDFCAPAEREAMTRMIQGMMALEALGKTWQDLTPIAQPHKPLNI